MKQYTGQIYQCDFCGKKSAWKHVITNHEKTCKASPNNKHKCFQYCEHLEKSGDREEGTVTFECVISGESMYSYKLEKNQNQNKERISKLKRMPLECSNYECTGGESGDYLNRFE